MPRILKNIAYLSQLISRSIPVIRMTEAIKMRGMAALEEANLLMTDSSSVSVCTGALVLAGLRPADELRARLERVVLLGAPVFALLEDELPERDLELLAIISRCSLSP